MLIVLLYLLLYLLLYVLLEEAENLRIRFYHSTYNHSFGSIFATVDVCALIPNDEADVCILEEPEHMNWMRVVDEPPSPKPTNDNNTNDTPPSSSPSENENTDTGTTTSTTTTTITTTSESSMTTPEQEDLNRDHEIWIAHLGWAVKFKHVVGIIHTNYDAYVRNYGMGTAFLAASALHALSALVTRAYCHRVIRLSDTLPSLDKTKEVTCNVHGVRSEFLEPAQPSEENNDTSLASVYFIGKLVSNKLRTETAGDCIMVQPTMMSGVEWLFCHCLMPIFSFSLTLVVSYCAVYLDLGQGI